MFSFFKRNKNGEIEFLQYKDGSVKFSLTIEGFYYFKGLYNIELHNYLNTFGEKEYKEEIFANKVIIIIYKNSELTICSKKLPFEYYFIKQGNENG